MWNLIAAILSKPLTSAMDQMIVLTHGIPLRSVHQRLPEICFMVFFMIFTSSVTVFINIHEHANYLINISKGLCLSFNLKSSLVF